MHFDFAQYYKQKGFAGIYTLIGLLVLGVISGVYYYSQNYPQDGSGAVIPVSQSGNFPELKGFPIYPGAIFIESGLDQTCSQKQQLAGLEVCNNTYYQWVTTDDFDQVTSWYAEATKKAGWNCNVGAGQYTSPRDASAFGNRCTKDGNSKSYELSYSANSKNTEISLEVAFITAKADVKGPTKDQSGFTKRNFDIKEKFFATHNYPQELLDIKEDDLVSTRCTPSYSQNENSYSYYDEVTKKQEFIFDSDLVQLVKETGKTLPEETISAFQYCETKYETNLLNYEVEKGGGGMGNKIYFALVFPDKSLKKITAITNSGLPYFNCPKLLQWTMSDVVYYQCGGGDGGFGGAEIYAFNVMTGETRKVIRCTDQIDNEGGQSTTICN